MDGTGGARASLGPGERSPASTTTLIASTLPTVPGASAHPWGLLPPIPEGLPLPCSGQPPTLRGAPHAEATTGLLVMPTDKHDVLAAQMLRLSSLMPPGRGRVGGCPLGLDPRPTCAQVAGASRKGLTAVTSPSRFTSTVLSSTSLPIPCPQGHYSHFTDGQVEAGSGNELIARSPRPHQVSDPMLWHV